MAIIVTGGGGFVGLNIVEAALRAGDEVILVTDRMPADPILAGLQEIGGKLRIETADVRDLEAMRRIFALAPVDVLFPFAALTPSVETEGEAPEKVIDVNLMGFIAQLRAAREVGVGRVIIPSSGGVYGSSTYENTLLSEATPCRPNSIYGTTKYAVETAGLHLSELWGLDAIAARIGGVFGPWERQTGAREMFGPHHRMLRLAAAGEDIILPAHFPATSSIYSRDLAAGLLHLARMSQPGHRVYNVCSGRNWAEDLPRWAETLCGLFPGIRWRQAKAGEATNITVTDPRDRGLMDPGRLMESGWKPVWLGTPAYEDYADWIKSCPQCF